MVLEFKMKRKEMDLSDSDRINELDFSILDFDFSADPASDEPNGTINLFVKRDAAFEKVFTANRKTT